MAWGHGIVIMGYRAAAAALKNHFYVGRIEEALIFSLDSAPVHLHWRQTNISSVKINTCTSMQYLCNVEKQLSLNNYHLVCLPVKAKLQSGVYTCPSLQQFAFMGNRH